MPEGETFILGETGNILQGLGAVENDIYMNGDKIKVILEKHSEMTLEEIKRIPQVLDEPALVLKSRNVGRGGKQNTRMVLFGMVKAQNGQPIMVVLDLRPMEGRFVIDDMQKVDSAYTKTQSPTEFVRNSFIMYADARKAIPLLRTIGFQMPIELSDHGFTGSIAYNGQNVNLFGKTFSEVFSEGDADSDIRYSDAPGDAFAARRVTGIAESVLTFFTICAIILSD